MTTHVTITRQTLKGHLNWLEAWAQTLGLVSGWDGAKLILASPWCLLSILSGGKCNPCPTEPWPALRCLLSSSPPSIHFLAASCWDYEEKRCFSGRDTIIHVCVKDYHEHINVADCGKRLTHTSQSFTRRHTYHSALCCHHPPHL